MANKPNVFVRVFTICLVLLLLLFTFLPASVQMRRTGVSAAQPGAASAHFPADAQSKTGPVPPAGTDRGKEHVSALSQVTLADVPAYIWKDGCGPTAAGMVIGYWASHGFPNLVSGDPSTQTTAVNAMIASSGHHNDYALPIDEYPDMLPDKSEPPAGDEHPDDSLADFMKTSRSANDNYYGWSWFSDVDDSLRGYGNLVSPQYKVTVQNQIWGTFTWEKYKAEIDAGRPVVLLVDSNGDGDTDHFVPAYGYDENGSSRLYAIHDTWDHNIHWYDFIAMTSAQAWGIYGATLFQIQTGTPTSTSTPSNTPVTASSTYTRTTTPQTPTFTNTVTRTNTPQPPTFTYTFTPTITPTNTPTVTPSHTPTVTATDTPTLTATDTPFPSATNTPGSIASVSIPLVPGWNLVSFNLHPSDTSVTGVLADLSGNFNLVYAWNAASASWLKYDSSAPPYANTLAELDESMGFWIHIMSAGSLDISGTAPGTSNLSLGTGWNLVGYPSTAILPLPDAFSLHGVGQDFTLVLGYHAADTPQWSKFDLLAPAYANTLLQLEPGYGYWIEVGGTHTWEVDY
jgi:hypothetical protein